MAELSSLIFVDVDELGRPTGLIASNEEDTISSSVLPSAVNDAVSSVQELSGLVDVAPILTGLPDDFNNLSSDVTDLSSDVGTFQNQIDAVSGLTGEGTVEALLDLTGDINDLSSDVGTFQNQIDAVSGLTGEGTVDSLLALTGLEDVSNVVVDGSTALGFISGNVPGLCGGPDVFIASSLSTLSEFIHIVDGKTGIDVASGNTLVIKNNQLRPRNGALLMSNSEQTAFLKVQNNSPSLTNPEYSIAYLSGQLAGLVGFEDILIGKEASTTVTGIGNTGPSSLLRAYTNQQIVTGIVDSGSAVMVALSGDRGDGFTKAESLSALNSILFLSDPTNPEDNYLKLSTADGLSANRLQFTGKTSFALISESDEIYVGSAYTTPASVKYTTNDFIKVKEAKNYTLNASDNVADVSNYVFDASDNIDNVSAYVFDASDNVADVSNYVFDASDNVADVSNYVFDASDNVADVSNYVFDASDNITDVSVVVADGSNIIGDLSGENKQLSAETLTLLGGNEITVGAETGSTSALLPILSALASVSGEGGGGTDSRQASALIVGAGSYADINTASVGEGKVLVYNGADFVYKSQAFQGGGFEGLNFTAPEGDVTYNFGPTAAIQGGNTLDFSGSFTSSGLAKTLLEFDDKSRVALGRNSVPLEISALGKSDVRLESSGTSGAFVLLKGYRALENDPSESKLHLQIVDLSADSGSKIDFDTDITLGATAHLDGNTLGAIHIACKNTQETSVSGGTPVYIKGNVGGSNTIQIGVASASVASSMPAIGILSEDLADNALGYVDAFGIASKLNTNAFAFGDTLYVAPTGGLTNVRPTATSDLVQNIGIVELSDPSNGKIIVLGPGRTNDVPTSVNNEVTFASPITINNTLTANGGTGSTHPTAGGQVLQSRSSNSVTWGNKKKLRWSESDFHSADVRINGPWLGAAVNSGTTGGGPAAALYAEMMGAVLLRSSTTVNSGYRWDTQAFDRIAPRKNLFFECIFAIPDDFTNKTTKLGFYDDSTNTTAGVDGTYFLIDNSGNMTPEASNNSTRTTGTSYALSVDTIYKAQIWWNGSSSVVFKITNMDESTIHAAEVINTNVPSGTARRFGAGLVTESSGTATDDLLVLDYMGWGLYPYREDDSL